MCLSKINWLHFHVATCIYECTEYLLLASYILKIKSNILNCKVGYNNNNNFNNNNNNDDDNNNNYSSCTFHKPQCGYIIIKQQSTADIHTPNPANKALSG